MEKKAYRASRVILVFRGSKVSEENTEVKANRVRRVPKE
jgi:hypothetical protein